MIYHRKRNTTSVPVRVLRKTPLMIECQFEAPYVDNVFALWIPKHCIDNLEDVPVNGGQSDKIVELLIVTWWLDRHGINCPKNTS